MKVGFCRIDKDGKITDIQREYFSQGWIFKDTESFEHFHTIPCYVPELFDIAYTRKDILALCDNQERIAEKIFYQLDWQTPEALLDEEISIGELTVCEGCQRLFESYHTMQCPNCGYTHG